MSERKVKGYPHAEQRRTKLVLETCEYEMPFNYPNVEVNRRYYAGSEFHGVEMNPINSIAGDDQHHPADTIVVTEEHPIVRVAVIGSACTPPGYVTVEAEPIAPFHHDVDVPGVAAARFRQDGLWGMHLRADQWMVNGQLELHPFMGAESYEEIPEARRQMKPGLRDRSLKAHYREHPLVGMSSAIFEIPASRRIVVSGGCEIPGWMSDNFPDDAHYSFRIIRVTVSLPAG